MRSFVLFLTSTLYSVKQRVSFIWFLPINLILLLGKPPVRENFISQGKNPCEGGTKIFNTQSKEVLRGEWKIPVLVRGIRPLCTLWEVQTEKKVFFIFIHITALFYSFQNGVMYISIIKTFCFGSTSVRVLLQNVVKSSFAKKWPFCIN